MSAGIEADLRAVVGSGNVVRASGADRVRRGGAGQRPGLAGAGPGTAYLADGRDTTNGFAGALLAARTKRPLLLHAPVLRDLGGAPRAGRAGGHPGGPARRRDLGARRSRAGSSRAAASTRPRSAWVLVNKRNPCRPRASSPRPRRAVDAVRRGPAAALGRRRGPRADGRGVVRRGCRAGRHRHGLPVVRHPEGAVRQVPRAQGPHLDRHLVPAARATASTRPG